MVSYNFVLSKLSEKGAFLDVKLRFFSIVTHDFKNKLNLNIKII